MRQLKLHGINIYTDQIDYIKNQGLEISETTRTALDFYLPTLKHTNAPLDTKLKRLQTALKYKLEAIDNEITQNALQAQKLTLASRQKEADLKIQRDQLIEYTTEQERKIKEEDKQIAEKLRVEQVQLDKFTAAKTQFERELLLIKAWRSHNYTDADLENHISEVLSKQFQEHFSRKDVVDLALSMPGTFELSQEMILEHERKIAEAKAMAKAVKTGQPIISAGGTQNQEEEDKQLAQTDADVDALLGARKI